MSCGALAKRVNSPISAAKQVAISRFMPRKAIRALMTGLNTDALAASL